MRCISRTSAGFPAQSRRAVQTIVLRCMHNPGHKLLGIPPHSALSSFRISNSLSGDLLRFRQDKEVNFGRIQTQRKPYYRAEYKPQLEGKPWIEFIISFYTISVLRKSSSLV